MGLFNVAKVSTPATILFEGPHRVGKSTMVGALSTRTNYFDVLIDRGVASNYAFGKLYGRPGFDLAFAWEQFFANRYAVVVHFELGASDFDEEIASGEADRKQWVGFVPTYSNSLLDQYISEAVAVARAISPDKVWPIRARDKSVDESCTELLYWLSEIRQLPV
jgi:hypothetical protein